MTLGRTVPGAMFAIRDLMRLNIDGQLAVVNQYLIDAGYEFRIPSTIPNDNIRIRQDVETVLPQWIPSISLSYTNRNLDPLTGMRGEANSDLFFVLQGWVTAPKPDKVKDLDIIEVNWASSMLLSQAMEQALERSDSPPDSIFGKADNSIQGLFQEADPTFAAYTDDNGDIITMMCKTQYRLLHRALI